MNIYINNDLSVAECFFSTPKYRPFIAISLGSKPPSINKTTQILKWALKSQSEIIPLLFADDIASINYRAFGDSETRAIKEVNKSKIKHVSVWKEALSRFDEKDIDRISFIGWKDVVNNRVQNQQNYVREAFNEKGDLYFSILALVESFIKSAGKSYNLQRGLIMAEYIIQELPLLIFGIELNKITYQMTIYPTYSYPKEFQSFLIAIRRDLNFKTFINQFNNQKIEYCKFIHMIVSDENNNKEVLLNSNVAKHV